MKIRKKMDKKRAKKDNGGATKAKIPISRKSSERICKDRRRKDRINSRINREKRRKREGNEGEKGGARSKLSPLPD